MLKITHHISGSDTGAVASTQLEVVLVTLTPTPPPVFVPAFTAWVRSILPILWAGQRDLTGTAMTDLSPHARNGVYQGGPTLGQAAIVTDIGANPAPAAVLYAAGQDGRVTSAPWLRLTNKMTMIAWVQCTGAIGADRFIAGPLTLQSFFNTGTVGFGFAISSGHTDLTVYAALGVSGVASQFYAKDTAQVITDGARHRLVMQYDGVTLMGQVDNNAPVYQAAPGVLCVAASTMPDFMVGRLASGERALNGDEVEDVVLVDQVLSAAVLLAGWNAGR